MIIECSLKFLKIYLGSDSLTQGRFSAKILCASKNDEYSPMSRYGYMFLDACRFRIIFLRIQTLIIFNKPLYVSNTLNRKYTLLDIPVEFCYPHIYFTISIPSWFSCIFLCTVAAEFVSFKSH